MILTPNQIIEILNVIKANNLLYVVGSIGFECLNQNDIEFLKLRGVDIDEIKKEFTTFEQAYYFGRLVSVLGNENAQKLNYNDLLQHLYKGQFAPLSDKEQKMLTLAKTRTYNHITWLTTNQQQDVNGAISEANRKLIEKQNLIKDEIALGVEQRKAYREISNDISKKLGTWQKSIDRIVETEYNTIFQEGLASELENKYGIDVEVYKEVYEGACRHCIKAYLTSGIGSKPRTFKLSLLKDNGTNIGRKVADWMPVLGSMHQYCRCNLRNVPKNHVWEDGEWKLKKTEIKDKSKGKIKITVGDKYFEV